MRLTSRLAHGICVFPRLVLGMAVISVFACMSDAGGQGLGLESSPAWLSGPSGDTRSIALADVDGDGDLDLACGNGGYPPAGNTLYENVAGVLSSIPSWVSGAANDTYGIAWADIDSDGDLDLVCGNLGGSNTLYENVGGFLSSVPVWSSEPANDTHCVALGDLDGDGDLDLACGNWGVNGYNTLYENAGGSLTTTPIWSAAQAEGTNSLAWADVDGDGDLDLACGNAGSNTLYENVDGVLSTTPIWSSEPTEPAYGGLGVAWADVDGDGDLDLACGNQLRSNTLYENVGGSLSTTPIWSSEPENPTESIAWADVDGDGDLDLACGNTGDAQSTLYENVDGILSTAPRWSSDPVAQTYSVAWGDMDGDGDLDLVCGNYATSDAVYENAGGFLSTTPAWSSGPSVETFSVAWADVDGDGDLDLGCGNLGGSNTLFENVNGSLSRTPGWSSGPANYTHSVAWADVDGDGDLDLGCGNLGGSNTLYENVGGTLATAPAWLSEWSYDTRSIAWADVDGDGDLDLACGNDGTPNTLYENVGGSLSTSHSWNSAFMFKTYGVAWADVDGDGHPDLACGNWNASNRLYRNVGGSLSETPDWTSEVESDTRAVAWGDVDGDGDPDLACGNYLSNTLYLNIDGSLSTMPSWSSAPMNHTTSVSWVDVDGDGDLDLVCGNEVGNDTIYENRGGSLSTAPIWSSVAEPDESRFMTQSAAWADVDGDGDGDLVCGNSGDPANNQLYFGFRAPAFKGSLAAPANHLPNNGAHLRFVETAILGPEIDNLRRVDFRVCDVDSDVVYIVPQFQFEGNAAWMPLELEDGSSRAGPFASSPEGVDGTFTWDVDRFPADERNVVLRLLVDEIPGCVGIIQHLAPYFSRIGPVVPRRPFAAVGIDSLQFGRTTVGDTASVHIPLENRGNETLEVVSVDLPSPEMTLATSAPLTVAPQASIDLLVSLQPRTLLEAVGEVLIHSNDPLNPTLGLAIEAEVLALSFSTELLRTQDVIPHGEAVTVVVQAATDVHLERGTLYYRTAGTASFRSISLARTGVGFTGIVPGADVMEQGLEYYVEMENSGLFAADPPGAPADSVFFQAVAAPDFFTVTPAPNAGDDFQQGQAVTINATLLPGSGFTDGSLHFRRGGERDFQTLPLDGAPPVLTASIPAGHAGPRGLEYYVEIRTATRTLTVPGTDPDSSPLSITVSVLDFEEADSSPGRAYRMVSMPLDMGEGVHRHWNDLLSVRAEFGPYDPVRWRSFRYDPASLQYAELDPEADGELFRLVPGKAFWLICHEAHRIGIGAVNGYSTPTDGAYAVTLAPGWNQIGNPFAFPVAWDAVLIGGLPPAEADTLCEGPIPWEPGIGYGVPAAVLDPCDGYFVKNLGDADITLQVPPREAPAAARKTAAVEFLVWAITIDARTAGAADRYNTVGVCAGARVGFDRFDRAEPPMSPDRAISLYFPHGEWRHHAAAYTADIRPERDAERTDETWGHVYWLDVAKNYSDDGNDEVTLLFGGLKDVPTGAAVSLVDHQLGQAVDLREAAVHRFHLGERDRVADESDARFSLLVGSEDFVAEGRPAPPRRTALRQNYPNPFNPSTVIRFDVAHPCRASLRIYDLRGALVKTLYDDRADPGGYELPWFGRNDQGRRVASGVYFYRLQTDDGYAHTRRLVMVQ